ncbi:MAG TPA: cytochrome c biogenesis protein CcdA [Bacteroidales bacterium]|nr:cytochrome c biogenesis protein CcdA [Bacteroidales bacterium]HPS17292.1 cytochrome c biogenesis protein CcdA [Bacteroidales bacterium]
MEEFISHALNSGQAGIAALIAVFLLGAIGVVSCGCNYAIIGIVAGYTGTISSTGKTKAIIWSGIFFLLGNMIAMAIIGGIIGYASNLISDSFGKYWQIIAGLIMIFFGLFTLELLPFKIPSISLNKENKTGSIFSSMIFGLTVGGLATAFNTCCNPVFPIVLAATFVKGNMLWGILLLLAFALGYGLPLAASMVGIGLGFGKISKKASMFGKVIKYAGGISLLVIGFYFLLTI